MRKVVGKKLILFIMLFVVLFASISFVSVNGMVSVEAAVLPTEQILPGELDTGKGVFEKKGEVQYSNKKYVVYKNTKLRSNPVKVGVSQGHYFDASRGKELPITYAKSKEELFSIGTEIASSLGVSVGAEAFGCSATVETEVTTTLGISTSLGKGYTETLTYMLNPNTNETGVYFVYTNAFVRDYKVETYEWKEVVVGKKKVRLWYTLWIKEVERDVTEFRWVKTAEDNTCYPESYFYTLEFMG